MYDSIRKQDPEVFASMERELQRQRDHLELIASENFVSPAVMEAMGSHLTNKYAEGYPRARYYGGCQYVDELEDLAIERAKQLFGAEHANVQPHSGSSANLAVYVALLQPGDTILGMDLSHGGHLTHGSRASLSGKYFHATFYGVDPETEQIDYDKAQQVAEEVRPKILIAGASAYPRVIDFKRMREIADSVGAYLMVDMAHIAGLVAAGLHPNPVPYADVVTTTTHKTLRGPRGAIILCKEDLKKKINSAVFPGTQGGPLMHIIAAKASASARRCSRNSRPTSSRSSATPPRSRMRCRAAASASSPAARTTTSCSRTSTAAARPGRRSRSCWIAPISPPTRTPSPLTRSPCARPAACASAARRSPRADSGRRRCARSAR